MNNGGGILGAEESQRVAGYFRSTQTAIYGFLMSLPLVLAYEVFIRWANRDAAHGGVRIGSEVWLKNVPMDTSVGQSLQAWLLEHGIGAELGMLIVVVLIGVGIYVRGWKRRPPLKFGYGLGIVLESAVYAVVLYYLVLFMTVGLMELGAGAGLAGQEGQEAMELSLFHEIALSIGAGIYEELLFRVIVTGGLFLILKLVAPRWVAYLVSAIVGALLFSWVHYTGSLGDPFTVGSFTFRALGGLTLNGLFLWRGFAVAAWTHAIYDIYIFTDVL